MGTAGVVIWEKSETKTEVRDSTAVTLTALVLSYRW